MQQRLYLRPEPQGQGAFRETGIREDMVCADERGASNFRIDHAACQLKVNIFFSL